MNVSVCIDLKEWVDSDKFINASKYREEEDKKE